MYTSIPPHLITASHFVQVPAMIIIYLLQQQTVDFFFFFPTYKTPICGLTTVKCQHDTTPPSANNQVKTIQFLLVDHGGGVPAGSG